MKVISPMKTWHQVVESGDMNLLDEILDEDCILFSSCFAAGWKRNYKKIFICRSYCFWMKPFKYTKEIESAKIACLEFELVQNEIKINGIDIISWNDDGKITEFKVMLRPLQAVEFIHKWARNLSKF